MLPQIAAPVFYVQLTTKSEKIKCRPFIVKEQKLLMMAAEENTPDALQNATIEVLKACTFGKVDIEQLAIFDLQYLFLKIRSKSIGESADLLFNCSECSHANPVSINLEEIKVEGSAGHTNKIMLTDKVGVLLKYPSIVTEKHVEHPENIETVDFEIIIASMESIFDQNTVYDVKNTEKAELIQFLESLTTEQYKKIVDFFETMPSISHKIAFQCQKCKHNNEYHIKEFSDFFEFAA